MNLKFARRYLLSTDPFALSAPKKTNFVALIDSALEGLVNVFNAWPAASNVPSRFLILLRHQLELSPTCTSLISLSRGAFARLAWMHSIELPGFVFVRQKIYLRRVFSITKSLLNLKLNRVRDRDPSENRASG